MNISLFLTFLIPYAAAVIALWIWEEQGIAPEQDPYELIITKKK